MVSTQETKVSGPLVTDFDSDVYREVCPFNPPFSFDLDIWALFDHIENSRVGKTLWDYDFFIPSC